VLVDLGPERRADNARWFRVLAVSPAYGNSGNGKIVHQEQPGEPTRIKGIICLDALDQIP